MREELPIEKRWNHRLVTLPIVVLVTIFIVWASFSEVDELVRGKGKVIPSSQKKILQHLEGGIVEKIYVKEGERVKKGDPIYKLKNSSTKFDSKQKEITLRSLRAKEIRLNAQINFKNRLDINDSNPQIENEIAILKSEMQNYQEQKSILQDELDQNRLEKKRKSDKLKNLKAQYNTQKENLKILKKLMAKGAASKKQYLAELAKSQSLQTEIGEIRNSIPMITGKIKSSITKIKKLKSEKRSAWLKELNEVTLKIEQLSQKKLASKDREVRKIITSPVNGIVQKLYFHTIGGIVKAGDRVAEITPVDDTLIIEAKIKTNDRGNILIDQNVSIDITAYSYTKYGLLNGKLISISPDSFSDQNGNSYYQVKVKADHYAFAPDKPILPGMVANINIKTGKKTIMRYLLKPLKDIRQNALSER
jgi:HlyD family secretion protein/adhesin transport system membrane fusion protein